jgi:hypothetical protein
MTFTKGAGASLVYDYVGGPLFEPALTSSVSWGVKSASHLRACAASLSICWISTTED